MLILLVDEQWWVVLLVVEDQGSQQGDTTGKYFEGLDALGINKNMHGKWSSYDVWVERYLERGKTG